MKEEKLHVVNNLIILTKKKKHKENSASCLSKMMN